jgi:hypothetical protein
MAFTFANNVSTTLASAISDSATTVVLTSAANLPTIPGGDYFAVTLNDAATQSVFEIVYVTAISGANLTVLRGQEGTAARAWLVGDFAFAADTDGILANFLQALSVAAPLSYTDGVLGIATPLAKSYGGTGTATPALVEGAGIDLTGTWPNETIANAGVLSINEETGAVEITGSGGAIVTQPSADEVNVNTSGLVKTIASVGETVTVARTGQAVNLEIGTGFVGQTVVALFNPTPSEINSGYDVEIPSPLPAGNWVVTIMCIGWGLADDTSHTIELTGTGGTFASVASLNGIAQSRTLYIAGTAVGGQQPGADLSGANVSYAAGSSAVFLVIEATRIS